jgi:hypothetical protein
MEATCSIETSVDFQRNIRRYIPGDRTLHKHSCENLKSYKREQFHQCIIWSNAPDNDILMSTNVGFSIILNKINNHLVL